MSDKHCFMLPHLSALQVQPGRWGRAEWRQPELLGVLHGVRAGSRVQGVALVARPAGSAQLQKRHLRGRDLHTLQRLNLCPFLPAFPSPPTVFLPAESRLSKIGKGKLACTSSPCTDSSARAELSISPAPCAKCPTLLPVLRSCDMCYANSPGCLGWTWHSQTSTCYMQESTCE